jgi:hypothetical protein
MPSSIGSKYPLINDSPFAIEIVVRLKINIHKFLNNLSLVLLNDSFEAFTKPFPYKFFFLILYQISFIIAIIIFYIIVTINIISFNFFIILTLKLTQPQEFPPAAVNKLYKLLSFNVLIKNLR